MRGVPYDVDECPEYGRAPFPTKVLYAELRGRSFGWCPGETAADAVHRAAARRRVRRTASEVEGDLRAALELGLARVTPAEGGAGVVEIVALPPSVVERRAERAGVRAAARERVAVRRDAGAREPKGDPKANYRSALSNHVRRLAEKGDPLAVLATNPDAPAVDRQAARAALKRAYDLQRGLNGDETDGAPPAEGASVAPSTGPSTGPAVDGVSAPVAPLPSPVPESGSRSDHSNSSKNSLTETDSGSPEDPTSPAVDARGAPVNSPTVNGAPVNRASLTLAADAPRPRAEHPRVASFGDSKNEQDRLGRRAVALLLETAGAAKFSPHWAKVEWRGLARWLRQTGFELDHLARLGAHWRAEDLAEIAALKHDDGIRAGAKVSAGLLLGRRDDEGDYVGSVLRNAIDASEVWERRADARVRRERADVAAADEHRRALLEGQAPAAAPAAPNIPGTVKAAPPVDGKLGAELLRGAKKGWQGTG